MPTELCKWGNSLGLRLPQYVIERIGLRPGDQRLCGLPTPGTLSFGPHALDFVEAGNDAAPALPPIKTLMLAPVRAGG